MTEPSEKYDIVPSARMALVKYGNSLVRRGLDDLSREDSHDASGGPADEWIQKGVEYEVKGHHGEAISCFENALEISPRSVDALRNKSVSLKSLGRFADAISSLDKCLEIDPSCIAAWVEKADTLETQGRVDEAIACYDSANQSSPDSVSAWMGKGQLLKQLGRYDEALACFDKVFEVRRTSWTAYSAYWAYAHSDAWNSKAATFYRMGRYQDAIECCDAAIDLDSSYSHPCFNKGRALAMLNRFDEAIGCYDMALKIDPKHAKSWNNKGLCLVQLGRLEEALDCYGKALSVDPPEVLGWYNKAQIQERFGHVADAITSYENYLEVASPKADAQFQYALERLRELKSKAPKQEPGGPDGEASDNIAYEAAPRRAAARGEKEAGPKEYEALVQGFDGRVPVHPDDLDSETRLYNSASFPDYLTYLKNHHEDGQGFSLLLIQINGLHEALMSLGPQDRSRLLRELVDKLYLICSYEYFCFRLKENEFAVVYYDIGREGAVRAGESVKSQIESANLLGGARVGLHFEVKIQVTVYPDDEIQTGPSASSRS